MKKEILSKIDRAIKEVWLKCIKRDYKNNYLLKEDTLKNSFYFHLRKNLGTRFFKENAIRIYTEFTDGDLKSTGYRADIAIVELSKDISDYLGDNIKSIIAIIEFKYGCVYTSDNNFYKDIYKVKSYIKNHKVDCLYYLGFIAEKEYSYPNWLDGRQTNNWASKKVTVLSANKNIGSDNMNFYVQSCNELNKDIDSVFL